MFKILIVDPNHPFRQSLKKLLASRFPSVDIQEASDGKAAMQKMRRFEPNLLFLEIHLPDESGLDLARRIKTKHPEVIVAMLTSYDLPEYQTAATESGIEHVVPKDDWSGEDIVELINSILSEL